ncbi:o-succinylbenzoate--CoA ligase [Exiguobacterium aestuarii]|uniref:2-succinylbenzoate--CoA ligase n=1 Tax=Exiguobacterium aestuarii TaxID=273527 RepID=A0ABW2PTM4_9BACL|nr:MULTISPECIES: o-succinylbenzoate--CoA ligase [Exiguobacterium]MCT4785898.1 o-succinylbenzoate--CoA ligase [Exiguobacterium aestuarii]
MLEWITKHPASQIALVTNEAKLTWGVLRTESLKLAQYIHEQDSTAERIGIFAKNSKDYVIAVHAVHLLGKVLVPFNTRLTEEEVRIQLKTAKVDLLLIDHKIDLPVTQLLMTCRASSCFTGTHEWKENETMSLMFTSGTTGRAKAVQQTYGNHLASARAAEAHLDYRSSDRMLTVTPLFHMSGLSQVYRSAIIGSTLYVEPRFDVERTLHLIETEGITQLSLVSIMLQRLLDAGLEKHHLRTLLVGGGPVPRPLLEEAERRQLPIAQTYGMTETCSQVATLLPSEALSHIGSSGRAIAPTMIRISQDGEIEVKGPTVTSGYFEQPESDNWTPDGYWKTGDLGTMRDGYLYVHDRRSDLIISGGENVYPAEIEAAMFRCAGVQDVGVTKQAHPTWGEVPLAFVVGSYDPTEMQGILDSQLAKYKHPIAIYHVPDLPRNANGKLMRHRLKELLP